MWRFFLYFFFLYASDNFLNIWGGGAGLSLRRILFTKGVQLTFSSACSVLSALQVFSFRVRMALRMDCRGCMDRSNWWYMFLQNLRMTKKDQHWRAGVQHSKNPLTSLVLTWNDKAGWRVAAQDVLQSRPDCRMDLGNFAFRSLETPTMSEFSLLA